MNENEGNTPESGTAENSGDATSAKGKVFSQDELDRLFAERAKQAESALLKKLGFENPTDAEALLKKAREREEADKSELQKARELAETRAKQIEELMTNQKRLATQSAIFDKANKLGIVDPDAAYRLIDQDAIEYDESGRPTNAEALLVAMLKDRPYLTGSSSSAMNPGRVRKFSREEIERMTPAEINKNWDAIKDSLESGR
jgi:hypothetical protein